MNRRDFLEATAVVLPAEAAAGEQPRQPPIRAREPLKITKLETLLVKPRWLFLRTAAIFSKPLPWHCPAL